MNAPPPTVALVDPIWIGHHETYFKAFIDALQEAGSRVIAVCPHPEQLEAFAQRYPNTLRLGLLKDPGKSRLFRGMDHDPILTHQRWQYASRAISQVEKESGWKADFVFFAWLDSYLRFMSTKGIADRLLGRPWTGLYFRNQHLGEDSNGIIGMLKNRLRGDFVLKSKRCRLVAGVDERTLPMVEDYAQKPVLHFPDITDEAEGNLEDPLAQTILKRADGRKVIGIIGLEKRKGFLTLLRVAQRAAKEGKPWYFAFTGVMWWNSLTSQETIWLKDFLKSPPENVYLDPEAGPVPDGPSYNGLASTFDVFYAAYLNSIYNGSSNVLTKAALLKIPVVVTKGFCLEERVNAYDLGLAISEDADDECYEALQRVLDGVNWEGEPLRPQFDDYFALHSHQKLVEHMNRLIEVGAREQKLSA